MSTPRTRATSTSTSRAVIVGAKRTPFVRAGGEVETLDVLELSGAPVTELMAESNLAPDDIDAVIFGNVSRPVKYHNLGREVVLATGIAPTTPAYTVGLACASSCQSFTNGVDLIERGYAAAVLTGGAESLSNVPIQYAPKLARALVRASRAKTPIAKAQTLATVRFADLAPVAPAIEETSTGLTMGQSAEMMAKLNHVSREDQDAFALSSHVRASEDAGRRPGRLAPVYVLDGRARSVAMDNHIRLDSSLDKLAALRPVFDPRHGTVTAGNSSPLTDGAAALVIMSEDRARANNLTPRALVRSYAYAAVDPGGQLLLGPAYAIPVALDRAGFALSDVDVIEMHEAFAAQVLATIRSLESKEFAERELGRASAVGTVDMDRLNVGGGSIALGHPFGATGARVLMDLVDHLELRDGTIGLASVCAAGGVGCAIVLERMT
ncbi:MAG TPA: acetyl-CoA C-acyltransferase [Chloroflexota bacterium]|jgi:acetyl-CoA acyltransferase|nr:acetyl-CoA C-acyltransferase [Chloroflexota bacterium]